MYFCGIFKNTFLKKHICLLLLEISHQLSPYCKSRGTYWLSHFIGCVPFLSISIFFSYFFVDFATCWSIKESFSILKKSNGVVQKFLNEVSRGEFLQPYLVINLTGLVQFFKILSYLTSTCLLELLAAEYVRETNTSIFISH